MHSFQIYNSITFHRALNKAMVDNPSFNFVCSYENCEGFSDNLLEKCQNGSCNNYLHHICQAAFEHRERLLVPLSKRCQKCLVEEVFTRNGKVGKQKGFMNCSVMVGPSLYHFGTDNQNNTELPFRFAKIVSIPRKKKGTSNFELRYDKTGLLNDPNTNDIYTKILPDVEEVRTLLKQAINRADRDAYRFDGNQNRRPKKKKEQQKQRKNQQKPQHILQPGVYHH